VKAEIGSHYFILEPVSFCHESTVYKYIGIVEQLIDYHIMNDVDTGIDYYLTSQEMESILSVPPVLREIYDV
jgi:hypothetical protein